MTDGRRGESRRVSSRKRICDRPECYQEWVWFRELGVPFGTYEGLYVEQNGKCALCEKWREKLRLDHCHETGRVRGLLCNACNSALGQLGDNEIGLERALAYIQGTEK